MDSRHWTPEVPDVIGVYHAYLRGYNRDVRAHRLFLGCSGGLGKASDEFCNLLIDVGARWTARQVAESEEAWWLRKACQRSRGTLLKGLADAFGLRVQHIQDIQAHRPSRMAVACTDTVEHDLAYDAARGAVAVYNGCCDTSRPFNGIVARMHPGEGLWLFRGAARAGGFGSIFGDARVCGAFPASQPPCAGRAGTAAAPAGSECVVRLHSAPRAERYRCFDEAYFRTLERMQWDRDNGHIELVPIVVGVP